MHQIRATADRRTGLHQIGLRQGIAHGSGAPERLRRHESFLASMHDVRDVVLVLEQDAVAVARTFARYWPRARIHLLSTLKQDGPALPPNVRVTHCATIVDRAGYLAGIPRPQLIIENGNNKKGQKLACFRELFPFLAAGGVYAVEELKAVHVEELDDYPGEHVLELLNRLVDLRLHLPAGPADQRPGDRELAASLENVSFRGEVAYVTKQTDHLVKVRDRAANRLLNRRYGSSWGEVVDTIPSYSWEPVGRARQHGVGPQHDRASITVPERYLRRYDDVLCEPRQRVIHGHHYLPDTFRHPLQGRLNHREIVDASAWLGRDKREGGAVQRIQGSCFYLDTEYPGHFGHVLTEVVSRYWGWQRALELDPGVRPLVSLDAGQDAIPEFQRLIFEVLGIPADRIEYVPAGTRVLVEHLYAATPGFAQPHYADQALAEVWERIGTELSLPVETPPRIFVSRRKAGIRTCTNTVEVEEFFRSKDFAVVYPEDHSFPEQVTMFRNASAIAGFGGSGMFSAMFAPGVPKLIVAGDGYTANNEFLIAAVAGGDVHYFWGDSEEKHPEGGWTWDAFQANFHLRIDETLGREVDEVLVGARA